HNEYLHLTLAHQSFHCCRNSLSEAVLFQLVPIGIFNAAAEVGAGALESATRSIAPLLVRWRIVIDEHTLDPEIRGLLVTCIAQEQRLAAVTDEYKRVMGAFQHAHVKSLQLKPANADKLWRRLSDFRNWTVGIN